MNAPGFDTPEHAAMLGFPPAHVHVAVVGWTVTDGDRGLGVVTIWDEAPAGAEAARVRWRSVERDVPVNAGGFLAAWWREQYPEDEWPTLVAFRVSGHWITVGPQHSSRGR